MVGCFSRLIFTLVSCGLSYREAESLPVEDANAMIACWWQSNGIPIERMSCQEHGIVQGFDHEAKFAEISNREKSWPLEQL
jgi:hypothetical protein